MSFSRLAIFVVWNYFKKYKDTVVNYEKNITTQENLTTSHRFSPYLLFFVEKEYFMVSRKKCLCKNKCINDQVELSKGNKYFKGLQFMKTGNIIL